MKFLTTLCLVASLALAGTAMGAARDVHSGLIQDGDKQVQTLFTFPNIAITTTDNCLAFSAATDDACANYALNTVEVTRAFRVTNISLSVGVSADAASTCDMFIEINGAAAGTEMTAFSVVTIGTWHNQAQNLLVTAGQAFSVNISDDSGCYDNTPPTVTVNVEGYFVD